MTILFNPEFLLMCSYVFIFFTCAVTGIDLTLQWVCPMWCDRVVKVRVIAFGVLIIIAIVLVFSTVISFVIADFYPRLEAIR